jgi:hypothetical protein
MRCSLHGKAVAAGNRISLLFSVQCELLQSQRPPSCDSAVFDDSTTVIETARREQRTQRENSRRRFNSACFPGILPTITMQLLVHEKHNILASFWRHSLPQPHSPELFAILTLAVYYL